MHSNSQNILLFPKWVSKKQKKILQIRITIQFKKKQVVDREENTQHSRELNEDSVQSSVDFSCAKYYVALKYYVCQICILSLKDKNISQYILFLCDRASLIQ